MSRPEVMQWLRPPDENFTFEVVLGSDTTKVFKFTFNTLVFFFLMFPEAAGNDALGILQTLYAMDVDQVESFGNFLFKRIE